MTYVIDGSNVFRSMDEGMLAVAACILGIVEISCDWVLFFDKSMDLFMSEDLMSDPQKLRAFDSMFEGKGGQRDVVLKKINDESRRLFSYLKKLPRTCVVPGGKKADWHILAYADKVNGSVISNDTFKKNDDAKLAERYVWVKDPRRLCQFSKVGEKFFVEGASILTGIPTSVSEVMGRLQKADEKKISDAASVERDMEVWREIQKACEAKVSQWDEQVKAFEKAKALKDNVRIPNGIGVKDIIKALFN